MIESEIWKIFKEHCFNNGYKIKVSGDNSFLKTYDGNQQDIIKLISSKFNKILVYEYKKGRYYIS